MQNDYLKYWKVVRQWARSTYKLSTSEIEMLLFLYSEGYFTRQDFEEYNEIMSWDKRRFDNLLRNGWIIKWRKKQGRESILYDLAYKSKRLCASIYKKLNKEEAISEDRRKNPMFRSSAKYSDKVYRKVIKKMNQERKL
jgi:hypothetical protein